MDLSTRLKRLSAYVAEMARAGMDAIRGTIHVDHDPRFRIIPAGNTREELYEALEGVPKSRVVGIRRTQAGEFKIVLAPRSMGDVDPVDVRRLGALAHRRGFIPQWPVIIRAIGDENLPDGVALELSPTDFRELWEACGLEPRIEAAQITLAGKEGVGKGLVTVSWRAAALTRTSLIPHGEVRDIVLTPWNFRAFQVGLRGFLRVSPRLIADIMTAVALDGRFHPFLSAVVTAAERAFLRPDEAVASGAARLNTRSTAGLIMKAGLPQTDRTFPDVREVVGTATWASLRDGVRIPVEGGYALAAGAFTGLILDPTRTGVEKGVMIRFPVIDPRASFRPVVRLGRDVSDADIARALTLAGHHPSPTSIELVRTQLELVPRGTILVHPDDWLRMLGDSDGDLLFFLPVQGQEIFLPEGADVAARETESMKGEKLDMDSLDPESYVSALIDQADSAIGLVDWNVQQLVYAVAGQLLAVKAAAKARKVAADRVERAKARFIEVIDLARDARQAAIARKKWTLRREPPDPAAVHRQFVRVFGRREHPDYVARRELRRAASLKDAPSILEALLQDAQLRVNDRGDRVPTLGAHGVQTFKTWLDRLVGEFAVAVVPESAYRHAFSQIIADKAFRLPAEWACREAMDVFGKPERVRGLDLKFEADEREFRRHGRGAVSAGVFDDPDMADARAELAFLASELRRAILAVADVAAAIEAGEKAADWVEILDRAAMPVRKADVTIKVRWCAELAIRATSGDLNAGPRLGLAFGVAERLGVLRELADALRERLPAGAPRRVFANGLPDIRRESIEDAIDRVTDEAAEFAADLFGGIDVDAADIDMDDILGL